MKKESGRTGFKIVAQKICDLSDNINAIKNKIVGEWLLLPRKHFVAFQLASNILGAGAGPRF